MKWFVYILKCADDSYYTGYTTNTKRRIHEHNKSNSVGSKYTRTRRPVTIVYREEYQTRSAAGRREREIKRLSRLSKQQLILGRVAQR